MPRSSNRRLMCVQLRHTESEADFSRLFRIVADCRESDPAPTCDHLNILPDDLVVVPYVIAKTGGLRERHAERRHGGRLNARQKAEMSLTGAEARVVRGIRRAPWESQDHGAATAHRSRRLRADWAAHQGRRHDADPKSVV